jgi:molybdate transport system regulatory protein
MAGRRAQVRDPATSRPHLRVTLEAEFAIGPGKADLLEAIGDAGSIAAAARCLGMSYRRAWQLVDELNRHLGAPVVTTNAGGSGGGGAALTDTGTEVLSRYRSMEKACQRVIATDVQALRALIRRNQRGR